MEKEKKTVWNFFERLEGDKVVWIITLMLILFSIVCIFSSSSRLLVGDKTRLDIVRTQLFVVMGGLVVIVGLYNIRSLKLLRVASSFGYFFSLILLLLLVCRVNVPGVVQSVELNGARRILSIAGKVQIHVFEVVKIAMVLYLAWVQDAIRNNRIRWIKNAKTQKIAFMYVPFLSVILLLMTGSNSAAIFVGMIMFLTVLLGGGNFKELATLVCAASLLIFVCWTSYELSSHKVFKRIGTGISRVFGDEDYEAKMLGARKGSIEYYEALDKLRQPYGAKIAIKQGGFLGKGPGQSSQRYVVPDMSEDYMFSFIIEEYGVLGATVVLFLYVSLLARGALIAKNCGSDNFAKLAVAGLILLISCQAFLHMFVNVGIGPMTGQTLPLISHGNSAFLCFCAAFGIILSISRIAKNTLSKEEAAAEPLVELEKVESQQMDSYEL